MLAEGVVYRQHREPEEAVFFPGPVSQHPRGGLLAGPVDLRQILRFFRVEQMHQVPAVVYDDIGPDIQGCLLMLPELRRGGIVPGIHANPLLRQSSNHIVLGGPRVAAADRDFGAPGCQHLRQIGGFRLQMDRDGHPDPFEIPVPAEILLDPVQDRHVHPDPVDFSSSLWCKGNIPNHMCLHSLHLRSKLISS
jgi:hypothetical protein